MMVTATAPVIIDPIASRMAGMTLALPAPAIAAEEPAYKEELQSFVVGSQVLSFVESVSTEYREAINNCCLLAHLYTKDQIGSVFEKGTMLFDWYNLYFSTLLNLGWTPQVQEFKVYEAGSDGADVSQALIELATSFLGGVPGAVGIIKGVLGALTKLEKDNPWITLFEREAHMQTAGRFQVGLVQPDAAAGFLVSNMAFFVDARKEITQVLFFKWKEENATLWTCGGNLTINQAAIAAVKNHVRDKVRDYVANFIKNINI